MKSKLSCMNELYKQLNGKNSTFPNQEMADEKGDINTQQHISSVKDAFSKLSDNKIFSKLCPKKTASAGVGGGENNTLCYHPKLDSDKNNEMKQRQEPFDISLDSVEIDCTIPGGYAYGIYLQKTIVESGTKNSQQDTSLWFINKCIKDKNLDRLFKNKSKVSCILRCYCFFTTLEVTSEFASGHVDFLTLTKPPNMVFFLFVGLFAVTST